MLQVAEPPPPPLTSPTAAASRASDNRSSTSSRPSKGKSAFLKTISKNAGLFIARSESSSTEKRIEVAKLLVHGILRRRADEKSTAPQRRTNAAMITRATRWNEDLVF